MMGVLSGLATAALLTSAAGTGFAAVSQRRAGKANQRIAEFNAQAAELQGQETGAILDFNAEVQEQRRLDALKRGRKAETVHRKGIRGLIGAQRAAFASQGVEVESGSSLDVQADTAALGERDALTIRANAAREAWGYGINTTNLRLQAEAARRGRSVEAAGFRMQGQLAAQAGTSGMFGTFLTGGSNILFRQFGLSEFPRRSTPGKKG